MGKYKLENAKKDLKSMTVLFRTQQAVAEYAKEDIKKYDLNISEFSVLEVLFHKEQLTVQGVCEKTLMPNSSMTYVLDKLSQKGFIKRNQDLNDKRIYTITLTSEGKKYAQEIFPGHYESMKKIFDVLTDKEQDELQILLKKIGFFAKEQVGK